MEGQRGKGHSAENLPTILLVEDRPLLAMLTQATLEEAGYEVAVASNGQQALEALEHGLRPSVLMTDIRLRNGLDGWQLAQKAPQSNPPLRVIYVSGDPDQDSAGGAVPGSVMLSKPLNVPRLLNALDEQ